MKQYLDLMENILVNGTDVFNTRTGATCRTLVGCQLAFDLQEGFPALTTRKLPFRSIVGELLGFFRGYTSAKDFRDQECKFWDGNANQTKAWLDNPYRKGEDDCGRIYGAQWTDWTTIRISSNEKESEYLRRNDWQYIGKTDQDYPDGAGLEMYRKSINQLENAVRTIITNPSDRRIIVSGWNIAEFDKMCLPACHMDYRFIPMEQDNLLHVVMTIRSLDVYLGTPANIASTALFLSIMARLTGYIPGQVIIQGTNVHLYENSLETARELITREPLPLAKLGLSGKVRKIDNLKDIKGCFERITGEDIWLVDYKSHSALSVPMIA